MGQLVQIQHATRSVHFNCCGCRVWPDLAQHQTFLTLPLNYVTLPLNYVAGWPHLQQGLPRWHTPCAILAKGWRNLFRQASHLKRSQAGLVAPLTFMIKDSAPWLQPVHQHQKTSARLANVHSNQANSAWLLCTFTRHLFLSASQVETNRTCTKNVISFSRVTQNRLIKTLNWHAQIDRFQGCCRPMTTFKQSSLMDKS